MTKPSKRKQHPLTRPSPTDAPSSSHIAGRLVARTSVFINYRRDDTGAAAEHLHASLAARLGAERVFRDVVTLEPGQDYAAVIDQAIRNTSVLLVLIGSQWLAVQSQSGRRRLDEESDLVRLEIETALKHDVDVIPVLVDGAKVPPRASLPRAIAGLVDRNVCVLPWHEGVAKLERRISAVELERERKEAAERAERERLDLTRGRRVVPAQWRSDTAAVSITVVVRAMELSLARRAQIVALDPDDVVASLEVLSGMSTDQLGFWFEDLYYAIDIVGVKAKASKRRFVARSFPIASFAELRAQLELGRPLLTSIAASDSWFRKPVSTTGVIDLNDMDGSAGKIVGAVLGWEPTTDSLRVLMPWSNWGDKGMATFTRAAAERAFDMSALRSIEPVLMPSPLRGKEALTRFFELQRRGRRTKESR